MGSIETVPPAEWSGVRIFVLRNIFLISKMSRLPHGPPSLVFKGYTGSFLALMCQA